MNLKLDDEWSIESDAFSFKLRYVELGRVNKKTGKPITTADETFHPNIEKALMWYTQNCIKPCDTAKMILDKLEEVKTVIKGLELDRYTVSKFH